MVYPVVRSAHHADLHHVRYLLSIPVVNESLLSYTTLSSRALCVVGAARVVFPARLPRAPVEAVRNAFRASVCTARSYPSAEQGLLTHQAFLRLH